MLTKIAVAIVSGLLILYGGSVLFIASAQSQQQGQFDAVVRAQEPMPVAMKRPEQQKTAYDNSRLTPQEKTDVVAFMRQL